MEHDNEKSKKLIDGLRQLNESIQDLLHKMQKTIAEVDHRVKKARKVLKKPYVCKELNGEKIQRTISQRSN
jgi:hypothetical protein